MTKEEFKIIELISKMSIDRASQVFSKTLRAGSKIEIAQLRKVDISQISEEIEKEDHEVSGAIVQLTGDTPIMMLFMVGLESALVLTDLFLKRDIGTTKDFGPYTEGTIQEIGNILASSISNVFSKDFGVDITPTPPIVLNDYSSSIFNSILMDEAYQGEDEILLVETKFFVVRTAIDCSLFLFPTKESVNILLEKYQKYNYS